MLSKLRKLFGSSKAAAAAAKGEVSSAPFRVIKVRVEDLVSFVREKIGPRIKPIYYTDQHEMAEVKIIVGLGNPGREYEGTRHNAGFEVVDLLADRLGIEIKKKKFGALFGEGFFDYKKVLLVKPQEYMNRSGQAVATVAGFYKVNNEDIIVVTDDLALEPGRIRLRAKGSAGGHNGLQDIISKIGSGEFARVRIGIGESGVIPTADYVLSRPSQADRALIKRARDRAKESVECWLRYGIDTAMNKYN
jgi:PTH1 family peptidyl-tRNA hydrolase